MDNKSVAKFVVFVLVWVNAFLSQHGMRALPIPDYTQIAIWIAFAYSAYEWIKHAWGWIKTNWVKSKPQEAPQEEPKVVSVPIVPIVPPQPTATPAAAPQTAATPTIAVVDPNPVKTETTQQV